jgi:hypothetical protein
VQYDKAHNMYIDMRSVYIAAQQSDDTRAEMHLHIKPRSQAIPPALTNTIDYCPTIVEDVTSCHGCAFDIDQKPAPVRPAAEVVPVSISEQSA